MTSNIKKVKWLSLGHFITDSYTGFINPIMPYVAANLGITLAMSTVVLSISNIFSSLLQPIFGFFADNINKRFFIFWGLILVAIFIPLIAISPNIYILILFIILGSLGGSFFHPQATGFVNKFAGSGDIGAREMGIFISMGFLGYALGPLIATSVVQYFDISKVPFTSITGILLAATMFFFIPKIPQTNSKPNKFIETFKILLTSKPMNLLMIISMLKVLITMSCSTLLPFLWKDEMHHTPLYIGVALFLSVIFGGIASMMSRTIEIKFGTKNLLYFSMIATFPMMLLFHYTYKAHPIFSIIIFIIIGFTANLSQPVTMVLGQKLFPEYKSIVAGFMNGFAWGVIAICLSFIGLCAQNFGIMNVLVILSIIPAISSYIIKYLPDNI